MFIITPFKGTIFFIYDEHKLKHDRYYNAMKKIREEGK